MKYLLFVSLFCCQLLASQNNIDKCDSFNISRDELQYLKPITRLGQDRGFDKLNRKKNYILSKHKVAKIGDIAHDFAAINPQGDTVKFSSVKDKYKLLVFTHSYCGPCIKSIKELRTIHEDYNNRLAVISFYKDKEMKTMLETIKKRNVSWMCLWDGQEDFNTTVIKYGVRGIPMFFLIDNSGVIVDLWRGYREGIIKERINKIVEL
ncbi:TlpA family protein disulfide reductase [Carboxylicivirga marina]|uniref:TlpA family protein disulfide reductase n=1 Tax=Carboxylicivirga marina TaxID=2800988 RepID=UPI002599289A|nr:TlpA disulfide reductase family protein [uncultured Carboxylicivirga sp.]